MEKIQSILEKLMKVMFIVCIFLGDTSIILLFKMHVKFFPKHINFYPEEIVLIFGMIVIYLLAVKFRKKYFKWLSLVGVILGGINLIGFRILACLM